MTKLTRTGLSIIETLAALALISMIVAACMPFFTAMSVSNQADRVAQANTPYPDAARWADLAIGVIEGQTDEDRVTTVGQRVSMPIVMLDDDGEEIDRRSVWVTLIGENEQRVRWFRVEVAGSAFLRADTSQAWIPEEEDEP